MDRKLLLASFRKAAQGLRRRAEKWIFFNLQLKHSLYILSGLFVVAMGAMLIRMLDLSHEQKICEVWVDLAGQRQSKTRKYLSEILAASQGIPVDPQSTRKELVESQQILLLGGIQTIRPGENIFQRVPAAPTQAIRNKLLEQEHLLEDLDSASDRLLRAAPADPRLPALRRQVWIQANLLTASAHDTVRLYRSSATLRMGRQMWWNVVVVLNLAVIGIMLGVHAARSNRRLETEMQERRRALWQLCQTEDQLRRAHDELETRVRVRTEELSKTNQNLETLLYVISHDLKEPLRSIENFSSLMVDRYAGSLDEKSRGYLSRVGSGVERLHDLLDDILILSRAQKIGGPFEEVDGASIVREALARLGDVIRQKKASIRIDANLPVLRVEKFWAVEALFNLVSNALKFTRDGTPPEIEIESYRSGSGGAFGFVVKDRGMGVSPEHSERIFQLFQRGVGREIEGTGAGLAIVRQVAQGHGGRAWVEPRSGGGSRFFMTFSPAARGGLT